MKIFLIIALLATFCAINYVECQVTHSLVCDAAMHVEMLLEFRTANITLISKALDSIVSGVAFDETFSDTDIHQLQDMILAYKTNTLNSYASMSTMTTEIYGQLMANFKPILKKVCRMGPNPCGTFVPYNGALDQVSPLTGNAYYAGKYRDNYPAYIGGAYLDKCDNEHYVPARCQNRTLNSLTNVYFEAGCYALCGFDEYRVKNPVAYLQYHVDFVWVPAGIYYAPNVPNIIKIQGAGSFGFVVGRIQLIDSVFNSYTQVGKFFIKSSDSTEGFHYGNENYSGTPGKANGSYEVLTCSSTPVDNGFVAAIVDEFAHGYSNGYDLVHAAPNDAKGLKSKINRFIGATLCLAALLFGKYYQ